MAPVGRQARLEQADWWDGERVAGARALVAGSGALGNEVVKNLVLLGWGGTVVVDFDVIEEHNLSRSVLFRPQNVGWKKSSALATNAASVNPEVIVVGLVGDLRMVLSAGLVSRFDVVLGCLDNLAARMALAELAGSAGVLLVDGGLTTWEGAVRVFLPPDGACHNCGLSEGDLEELRLRRSCPAYEARARAAQGIPTTPTVASITAGLMVQQALKWIHGRRSQPDLPLGQELRVDTAFDRFWKLDVPRNWDCLLHPELVKVAERTPSWELSWADILQVIRAELDRADANLLLPQQVLESWTCPACGASADVFQVHDSEEPVSCTSCGQRAIPVFNNQVLGGEAWRDRSPASMGFPPWTWVTALADSEEHAFELDGAPESLKFLARM